MTTRGDSNIFRKIALLLLFFLFLSFPSLLLYFYLRKVFTHVKMTDRLAIDDDGQKLFKKDWILINHFSYFLAPNCCFQSKKNPRLNKKRGHFLCKSICISQKPKTPKYHHFKSVFPTLPTYFYLKHEENSILFYLKCMTYLDKNVFQNGYVLLSATH